MKVEEMNLTQLLKTKALIEARIATLQTEGTQTILIKSLTEFPEGTARSRYNGGWLKTVTGIDKTQTNGYSLIGKFVNLPANLTVPCLLLNCNIAGSRKNQAKRYQLFKLDETGAVTLVKETGDSKTWAVDLWEEIEQSL
jgi:hypothetical protein